MKKTLITLISFIALVAYQNSKDEDRTWSVYKADSHSTSYSPLDQINTSNVAQLQPAWTFALQDMKDGSRPGNSECNPIIVDGVMYATSAKHWVYAVNASTGEQIWSFDPFDGAEGGGVSRGLTYWEEGIGGDAKNKRILVTGGDHLFALDIKTGNRLRLSAKMAK
jgi:quinoprotein glucose dehydrogenase